MLASKHSRPVAVLLFVFLVVFWRLQTTPVPTPHQWGVILNETSGTKFPSSVSSSIIEPIATPSASSTNENVGSYSSMLCGNPLSYITLNRRKPLLLASYPGSGNTWMRHLIQSGSRKLTGSVYNDRSIIKEFPAEGKRDGSVVVVKTHFPCAGCWKIKSGALVKAAQSGDLRSAGAVVYILRSPFDTILAEFKRKMTGLNHTGEVDPEIFQKNIWLDFVRFRSKSWFDHASFYLNQHIRDNIWRDVRGREVFLIIFEDVKNQMETTMKGVFEYIFKYQNIGSYKRKSKNRINPYTEKQRQNICGLMQSIWQEDNWGKCDGSLQWERTL